jgi:hypothetical protein
MTGPDSRSDDDAVRRAARGYHEPPPTPREAMWSAIEARLGEERGPSRTRFARRSAGGWVGLAVAASAILALGVGLGRVSAPTSTTSPSVASDPTTSGTPERNAPAGVRLVAERHLEASESLLRLVQADARAGHVDAQVGGWARGLLLETRMLLDSDASRDPVLRELLQDLELLFAQVAMLDGTDTPERARTELDLIAGGLHEQSMMTRIQSALPAAAAGLSGT